MPGSEDFWGDALFILEGNDTVTAAHNVDLWVKLAPLVVGLIGIGLAYLIYMFKEGIAGGFKKLFKPVYLLFLNKWYFDELYNQVFTKNTFRLGNVFWKKGDKAVIDGLGPDGVSKISRRGGSLLSKFQAGLVYQYAFVMMLGVIGIVTWLFIRLKGW